MNSNKRGIVLSFAGALVGAAISIAIPGDTITKFLLTFAGLFVVMVVGIYALNRQAKSNDTH